EKEGNEPHCLKQNVTNSVPVPKGMDRSCHSGSGEGWRGSAWRHGEAAIVERYRGVDKRRILDEFKAVTGYYRKRAIRLMNRREQRPSSG
ncbi:MAG: hypothetical protein E5W83_39120, partial [Mesorhizobium sp.]